MNRISLVCLLAGFASLISGAALIYHPLGFLVAGSGLVWASLISNKGKK
jgi:hypothetical protein